jgi:predicted Zn-ribbon and HTH transcriptional regulator
MEKPKISLKSCECKKCGHKFNALDVNRIDIGCFSQSASLGDLYCPKCKCTEINGADNALDDKNKDKINWGR